MKLFAFLAVMNFGYLIIINILIKRMLKRLDDLHRDFARLVDEYGNLVFHLPTKDDVIRVLKDGVK
jgi:hypothetical protein